MKHGYARRGKNRSREYIQWASAKRRCYNPRNRDYRNYGGRGITVCAKWINDFPAFFKNMGPCPKDMTLERIDNSGNYEPKNCRWATRKEQNNNKRNNHLITIKGKILCLTAWCKITGISHTTVIRRINAGWPIRKAVLTPGLPPSERAAVLTPADVINIRKNAHHVSRKQLMERYRVSRQTITRIIYRRTWKHLTSPVSLP